MAGAVASSCAGSLWLFKPPSTVGTRVIMSVSGDGLKVPSICAGVGVLDRVEVVGCSGVALCCSDSEVSESEVSEPEVSGPSSGVGSASAGESVASSSRSIGEFGSAVGSPDAGRDPASPSDEPSVWALVRQASDVASVRAIVGTVSDVASVWTRAFTAPGEVSARTIVGTASDVASVWTLLFAASDEASMWPLMGIDSVLADSADDPTPRSPWAGFSVLLRG